MDFKKFIQQWSDEKLILKIKLETNDNHFEHVGDFVWQVELKKQIVIRNGVNSPFNSSTLKTKEQTLYHENTNIIPTGYGSTLEDAMKDLTNSIKGQKLDGLKEKIPNELNSNIETI